MVAATATQQMAVVPSEGRGRIAEAVEKVLIGGDLSKLTPEQRLEYYQRVCASLGLNPLTRPFEYIILDGKLVLYARKDASEQLRDKHGVSITELHYQYSDDLVIVTATARDSEGRVDSDVGAVPFGQLKGVARANALKKAVTQAKRRVTLSICGLGMLDETEIESIQPPQGAVIEEQPQPRQLQAGDPEMAALREELEQWFVQYPDAKAKADAMIRAANAGGGLSDVAVRKAVAALRQRAADEETSRQAAASLTTPAPPEPPDLSTAERLAAALAIARGTVKTLAAKRGGPNAGDYEGLRQLISEIQRTDPLPDDSPPADIPPKLLLDALRSRLAVADAGGGEAGAQAVEKQIDDAIPF